LDFSKTYFLFSCFYHGHEKCYPDENQILAHGQSARKLREATAKKKAEIEEVMDYKVFWTCEIEEMLAKSKQLQRKLDREEAQRKKRMDALEAEFLNQEGEESSDDDESFVSDAELTDRFSEEEGEAIDPGKAKFLEECKADGPIKVSDGFFGGRTNTECLFSTTIGNPNKVIAYRDVTSLYPKT
jgi:hypothetical protein